MKLFVDSRLAEAIPDGTFGGSRPWPNTRTKPRRWTREEQAAHREALLAAISARRCHPDDEADT
ncbi:hypothetical protein OG897_13370 [Streptomyces sp. NBC_00237]|uniref:hypothetical protein n=1 Tax=Streptomyces sp. NBC_00237 TaxID=2975687 RepID=UPI0022570D41|nr:hypothetical protein [Streptomyces sp. NBC_00237]MCX5202433.1 hypothetical protein [Streptomyces sp. NBC_00237]